MLDEWHSLDMTTDSEVTARSLRDTKRFLRNTPLFQYLSEHYPQVDRDTLRIARGLSVTHIMMMAMADDYLRPLGLSWSKLFVLLWLRAVQSEGSDGMAPSALSDCLVVTRNTISTLLSGLERQGFVTRAIDKDDKRRFLMRLTPSGEEAADTCAAALFNDLQDVMGQVSADDRGSLLATLAQIQDLLQGRLQQSEKLDAANDS